MSRPQALRQSALDISISDIREWPALSSIGMLMICAAKKEASFFLIIASQVCLVCI